MIYADYVYPAVRSTLEALRARGILTALASSSPRKFIDRFLDETGLTELFDYTVSGEECENHKPAPDVYLRAMEALGVHPDEVLVVEDSPLGIAAGRAAGAFVLAPSVPSAPNVDQSEADACIEGLDQVLEYLER